MQEYILYWKRAFDFAGVSRRREYFIPILINAAILVLADLISEYVLLWDISEYTLSDIWFFIVLIPNLAVTIRRLHDTNRTGWFLFMSMVPFGNIFFLVWILSDTSGEIGNSWRNYDVARGFKVKYMDL